MILQILYNSIVSGLLLALVALGFEVIFKTTKVFHIAHAAFFVIAPYILHATYSITGESFFGSSIWGLSLGIFLALMISVCLILAVEIIIYRPLYRKNRNATISLISSLGAYIFFVNALAFVFGNNSITISDENSFFFESDFLVSTYSELIIILVSILSIVSFLLLTKSKYFNQIRAVSINPDVAKKFGISVENTRLQSLIIGTVLVSIAGMLQLNEKAIDLHVGMSIMLYGVVALIIGGTQSIKGTIILCFIICCIQNFSALIFSQVWENLIVYILLLSVLFFYKGGIIANQLRIEAR